MSITIAIPTYNRSYFLSRLLRRLSEIDLQDTKLLIIDNCSTDDTQQVVDDYKNRVFLTNLEYNKNAVNVGGDANILRCFELANTEWLWIIGDDDQPVLNCIEILHNTISSHPDCQYINFVSTILSLRTPRKTGFTTSGVAELVNQLDCYSNILFISAGVFKRPAFLKHIPSAYRFIYAYSSQLALIFCLMSESEHNKCYFSPKLLIEWEPAAEENAWNQHAFNLGAPYVAETLSSLSLRENFIQQIRYIQDIAPSLTLRSLLFLSRKDPAQLLNLRQQYFGLAALCPSYSGYALIANFCVTCSKISSLMSLLRLLVKISNSKLSYVAKPLSLILDFQLLSKDIRKQTVSIQDVQLLSRGASSSHSAW